MQQISLFLMIIFILCFSLLFWFIQQQNKKEANEDRFLIVLVISILFSVMITAVFAFSLFVIIGSANVINRIFSFNITANQLVVIGISYLVYLLTLDNIFEKLFEYVFGESLYAILSLFLSRIAAFYVIGAIIGIESVINPILSAGVSFILLVIEALYYLKIKKHT